MIPISKCKIILPTIKNIERFKIWQFSVYWVQYKSENLMVMTLMSRCIWKTSWVSTEYHRNHSMLPRTTLETTAWKQGLFSHHKYVTKSCEKEAKHKHIEETALSKWCESKIKIVLLFLRAINVVFFLQEPERRQSVQDRLSCIGLYDMRSSYIRDSVKSEKHQQFRTWTTIIRSLLKVHEIAHTQQYCFVSEVQLSFCTFLLEIITFIGHLSVCLQHMTKRFDWSLWKLVHYWILIQEPIQLW